MDKETEKILTLLETNETLLEKFYSLCRAHFPEKKDFFEHLMKDENNHAQWVRMMRAKIMKDGISLRESIWTNSLAKFFEKSTNAISDLVSKKMDLTKALFSAVELEKGMLEKDYFESMIPHLKSEETKDFLIRLSNATKIHLKEVEEEWKKEVSS